MAIRHQPKSEKYPFQSPTTPGLYVTFRAYIIELICLNVNKSIGPRFWSDTKWWGPKFRREVKGVDNVLKQLETVDALIQTAFVQIVREHNIKSLTYKTTANKVVRNIKQRQSYLEKQRIDLSKKQPKPVIDPKKNATFIDIGVKGRLAKIRELENG